MRALSAEETARPIVDRGPLRRLGGYELRAKIADGGMAEVYVARRVAGPGAGEVVAIKTIREQFARNKEFVTMFMDEAKIVARLRHPNIIQYLRARHRRRPALSRDGAPLRAIALEPVGRRAARAACAFATT